ncbi:hypothetical protein [Streptomyces sp. NPDC096142]|uniref:hypothetical protein n=1 Tax=Streptomyces sp. NPDC096142 TaxID=3366077 RepID=UPI003812181C
MTVENQFVQEWLKIHQNTLVGAELADTLFDYLDSLPWETSQLQWSEVPHLTIPFADGDPQPAWAEKFTGTPIGRHSHILVAYAPGREAFIAARDEVLADLDLLYASSPGARYFCGADMLDEAPILAVRDFGEFSDTGVRVGLAAAEES